ncbi:MAG: permease [Candidatus Altiarchaeota archaeon]|nr:permease [Candidatus Altiarchaeota archaeon]
MQTKNKLAIMVLAFLALYFLPYYFPGAGQQSDDSWTNAMFMLHDYTKLHILTCLVPAFFIAGAISALVPKEDITKYLGHKVSRWKAYPLSVIAGFVLAVCSCTVLPLFAGIKKGGAGLGPAIAFLYTAPAINIMAIVFTGGVIGWDFAIARIVLSIVFATLIGIILSGLFKEDEGEIQELPLENDDSNWYVRIFKERTTLFLLTLFSILVVGTYGLGFTEKTILLAALIVFIAWQAKKKFNEIERESWLSETYSFVEKIFPLLIAGVFFAGFINPLIPDNFLGQYVGGNSVVANFLAVLFGVVMYFPTLVEVPMAQLFLEQGMGRGPLLAYLLADPVLSFPSVIVVRGLIGTKKTAVYVLLVTVFCTIAGLIFGNT